MFWFVKFCALVAAFIIINFKTAVTAFPKNNYIGIWNGEVADIEAYPFLASIQCNNQHVCGGAIVSDMFILTTASCLEMFRMDTIALVVFVGSSYLDKGGETRSVDKLIIHEDFLRSTDHDIGLLKVTKNLNLSPKVAIASLAEKRTIYDDDTKFEVLGWGIDSDNKEGILKKTTVYLIDKHTCSKRNGEDYKITKFSICAARDNHGPCLGDSGTPLTLNGTVVGLTSRAKRCASERYPTVYTRLSEFREWIENKIENNID